MVTSLYESSVEMIREQQWYEIILPSPATGLYPEAYPKMGTQDCKKGPEWAVERKARDPEPMTADELRNYDRFDGTCRPRLRTWRSFGGGGPRSSQAEDRRPKATKESTKASNFEKERRAGTASRPTGRADEAGPAPPRFPKPTSLQNPEEEIPGWRVVRPFTISAEPSAAILPGEEVDDPAVRAAAGQASVAKQSEFASEF